MEPVGRAAELREIDVLLEAAAAGSGGVLIFSGPSGSGKTMLIGAAAHRARSRGSGRSNRPAATSLQHMALARAAGRRDGTLVIMGSLGLEAQ